MDDLNRLPVTGAEKVIGAAELVLELTVMLQLSQAEMRLAFETSVLNLIPHTHIGILSRDDLIMLADGVYHGMVSSLRSLRCERVYRLVGRKGADEPTERCYGAKVGSCGDLPHFSRMTMLERRRAEVAYCWKGSKGKVAFTAWAADAVLPRG